MEWQRQQEIDGDPETVYRLIAVLERWPRLFPQVRRLDVLWEDPDGVDTVARFASAVGWLTVTATCQVHRDAGERTVVLRHLKGPAAGLQETWRAEALPDRRTRLRYCCVVGSTAGRVAAPVARAIVTRLASRMSAMVTLLAEADRAARVPLPGDFDEI